MNKSLVAVYRITGIIVSLFSYLLLFSGLTALFQVGAQGMVLLGVFLAACLVIYSILSGMFARLVLMLGQPIRYSLKDWIKVNAYVSILFSGLALISMVIVVSNPAQLQTLTQQYPAEMRPTPAQLTQALALLKGLLVICALTFAHCIWTLRLVRKFREFFQ
jgi:hypothetical protein